MGPSKRAWVSAVVWVALAVSCHGRKQPSAEYVQATDLWASIVEEKALEAAADPRSDQVLVLLGKVSPDSYQDAPARALADQIRADRKAIEARRAALAAPLPTRAEAPPPPGSSAGSVDFGPAVGTPAPAAPGPGAPIAEVKAFYGDCLALSEPFEMAGTPPVKGDAFVLQGRPECASKFPDLVDHLVLVSGDKLHSVVEKARTKRVEVHTFEDGGTVVTDLATADAGNPDAGP